MIIFTIPGAAPSTPNLREHHMVRARRVKAQRAAVAAVMPRWTSGPLLHIRLTRVASRSLDTDNLAAALKAHRDAVAAKLRVDDATPLVQWWYEQAKGDPAVVVEIWLPTDPTAPSCRPTPTRKPTLGQAMHTLMSMSPADETQALTSMRRRHTVHGIPHVPPCDHCGEPYDPKCYDPIRPPGSISCTKDVHCFRFNDHPGDCQSISPRACTT